MKFEAIEKFAAVAASWAVLFQEAQIEQALTEDIDDFVQQVTLFMSSLEVHSIQENSMACMQENWQQICDLWTELKKATQEALAHVSDDPSSKTVKTFSNQRS